MEHTVTASITITNPDDIPAVLTQLNSTLIDLMRTNVTLTNVSLDMTSYPHPEDQT